MWCGEDGLSEAHPAAVVPLLPTPATGHKGHGILVCSGLANPRRQKQRAPGHPRHPAVRPLAPQRRGGCPLQVLGELPLAPPRDEYSPLSRWSSSLAISSKDIPAKTSGPRLPPRRPHRRWPFLGFVRLATLPLMQALYLASFARGSAWMCTSKTRAAHSRHRGGCAVLLPSAVLLLSAVFPSASLEVSGLRAPRRSWMHFVLKANSKESLQGEGYPGKWWQEFLTALRGWAKLTPKTNHQLPATMSPLLP